MTWRMGQRSLLALALAGGGLGLGAACTQADAGTAPEVVETTVKLDLPAVPEFTEPQTYNDGTHSVLEMRRKGKKFLDQDVKIKGYVVWIYDCVQVLGPQVLKDTPERCDRPNFYLGDAPDATHDKAIWVVDVPRALRPDENDRTLGKEIVAEMKAAYEAVPKFTVGNKVVVSGKWVLKSPKGFANSDGLVAFAALENLDAPSDAPPGGPAPAPGPTPAPTKRPPPH